MSTGDSGVELRPVGADHVDQFEEYVQYGFWPEQGSDPAAWNDAHIPDAIIDDGGERWGLFVDGSLKVAAIEFGFRAHFRGDWYDVAGVSSGVTPPEFRRQGHTLQLAPRLLQRLRERDVDFVSGWEFNTGFWRRFGLALAGTVTRWQCSPGILRTAVDARTGSYRRVSPDSWRVLDDIHREHVGRFEHTVDRTETWWRELVLDAFDQQPHVAIWEHDGEPRGYVVYRMIGGGDVLNVEDIGYVDREAYRHLLHYLGLHDGRIDEVMLQGPERTELYDLVRDPAALECQVEPGPSVRIVDVASALSQLAYPDDAEGTVAIDVRDEIVDWNDRTVRLAVADGSADCEPTDDDPDVSVDIATLSQLVAGYRPARALARTQDLTIHDEAAGDVLSAAFPAREVFLFDRY